MREVEVFKELEAKIAEIQREKSLPVRVAINGIEGTGKTTFAKKLVAFLKANLLEAVHVSIDGFHLNKERRHRQGRDSARGYYEDSYDERAFVEKVLLMSQGSESAYIPATHDLESDEYLDLDQIELATNSILVVDGAYLFKPIYEPHWDLKIYLKTDSQTAMNRGIARDQERLGGEERAKQRYLDRYHAASQIYIEEVQPESLAHIIIDNTDFENLLILRSEIF